MRERIIYNPDGTAKARFVDGELVGGSVMDAEAPYFVMDDIKPYKSMITGEMITSRSQHREHLRQHGCQELGNEPLKWLDKPYEGIPDCAPQQRRELIRTQIDAMRHAEFKALMKRSVDRVKWNSRKD